VNFVNKCGPKWPITLNKHKQIMASTSAAHKNRTQKKQRKNALIDAPLLPNTSPISAKRLLRHSNAANDAGHRDIAHVRDCMPWRMVGRVEQERQTR
jgi:hypothetical protein